MQASTSKFRQKRSNTSLALQLMGVGVISTWVFITSVVVWYFIRAIFGILVRAEEEYEGLDVADMDCLVTQNFWLNNLKF